MAQDAYLGRESPRHDLNGFFDVLFGPEQHAGEMTAVFISLGWLIGDSLCFCLLGDFLVISKNGIDGTFIVIPQNQLSNLMCSDLVGAESLMSK